jgi:hypothetical protein
VIDDCAERGALGVKVEGIERGVDVAHVAERGEGSRRGRRERTQVLQTRQSGLTRSSTVFPDPAAPAGAATTAARRSDPAVVTSVVTTQPV